MRKNKKTSDIKGSNIETRESEDLVTGNMASHCKAEEIMANLVIGTSGYSYKEWIGSVYPEGTNQKDFLKLYAREFHGVELNFSYYRQLEARTIAKMLEIVPQGFLFTIKAYKGLTHEISDNPHTEAVQFKQGVLPMLETSSLGAVLLQFPYRFHYTLENRRYLQKLCSEFEAVPLAIEFRNREWLKESVYDTLRKLDIALACLDEPDLPNLIRPSDVVTAHFSYVRFHGRNKENWWTGDNRMRYDYLYSDQELVDWIPRIRSLAGRVHTLFVFFNNHWKGQAVLNARRMGELLA